MVYRREVDFILPHSYCTYESGGSRHLQMSTAGTRNLKVGPGEYKVVPTKGHGTSAAVSVLTKLLSLQTLRAGDGLISIPESRMTERLFGQKATGRRTLVKVDYGDAPPGYISPRMIHALLHSFACLRRSLCPILHDMRCGRCTPRGGREPFNPST